jgi:hypothetical protein
MTDPIRTLRAETIWRAQVRKITAALIVVSAIAIATVVVLTFLNGGF